MVDCIVLLDMVRFIGSARFFVYTFIMQFIISHWLRRVLNAEFHVCMPS